MILALLLIFGQEFDHSKLIKEIAVEEKVPENLLKAIVRVESKGFRYAVYGAKKSHMLRSKEAAVQIVSDLKKSGRKNINCGLMQINLQHHDVPLDKLFTPEHNIRFGAKYLRSLFNRFGSWRKAVGFFHSGRKRQFHAPYFARINCNFAII